MATARGSGGGKRSAVGERRRAAAARALGISVEEKQRLDAANTRAHELYGLGIGVLVFEQRRFATLAESLETQAAGMAVWGRMFTPTWWQLRRQARQARRDAELWDQRLAQVAHDLAGRRDGVNVAASPGER